VDGCCDIVADVDADDDVVVADVVAAAVAVAVAAVHVAVDSFGSFVVHFGSGGFEDAEAIHPT